MNIDNYLTLHYEFEDATDPGKDTSGLCHGGKSFGAVSLVEIRE